CLLLFLAIRLPPPSPLFPYTTLFRSLLQDPAPDVFSQPLPVRPPGDVDRAHRRRSAVVPVVLPAPARLAPGADRYRARLSAGAPFRGFPARSAQSASGVPIALSATVRARGQPPAPGS